MSKRNILCITHEDFSKNYVARNMFYDVFCHKLFQEKYSISFISAGKKIAQNNFTFKRNRYKAISFKDFLSFFYFSVKRLDLLIKSDLLIFRSYPSYIIYYVFALLLKKKTIFDTRGLFFDELYDNDNLKNLFLKKVLYRIEKLLLKKAVKVICVTASQAKHYKDKYSISNDKLAVIHNGAKLMKISTDNSFCSAHKISFLYLGSSAKWHSINWIKNFCDSLNKIKTVKFTLTIITKDIDILNKVFENAPYPVNIKTQNFRDFPERHDYGFSIISGGVSKSICFPVKVCDYLNSGTKVIFSENVDEHNIILTNKPSVRISTDWDIKRAIQTFLDCHNNIYNDIPVLDDSYSFEKQIQLNKLLVDDIFYNNNI